tara:strand:- start:85 stop:378 length:294 start_codon:yes stop_codon:yes gene_type:complete
MYEKNYLNENVKIYYIFYMIRNFKRNIYNNINHVYLGLSYKKYIYLPLNQKCIYLPLNKNIKPSKIPKYLDITLEELIKNKKNINQMHRLIYKNNKL